MRATLESREDCLINLFRNLFTLSHKYHAPARTTERLVSGGGHNIKAVVKRILRRLPCYESGDVRDVHHSDRSHFTRDSYKLRIVELARIRRESSENNLRLDLLRNFPDLCIVDLARLDILHLVPLEIEDFGEIRDRVPVGEMPTVREIHTEHRVSWLE